MSHICDPFAYGNGPVEACFWNDTAVRQNWPALEGEATADVVVIGAGFTGLTTALHLAEAGMSVTILDARQPGWGASGRNGGFCCLGGSRASNRFLRRRFGAEGMHAYRLAERDAVDLVARQLDRLKIDADVHSEGETVLAHRPGDYARMQADAREIDEVYGIGVRLVGRERLAEFGMNGPFHGAMTIPIGFALNPLKYALGLARAADAAGARIHGESPVTRIAQDGAGWRVETADGAVRCEKVVVATNGYSSETVPNWMAGRYMPVQSNVIVTRVLSPKEQEAQGWTSLQMSYDTRNLLHYFRLMPDGRFLFGMRGGLRTSRRSHAEMRGLIRRDFEKMFPHWAHVEAPWFWSGFVCMARDQMPFAGEVPGQPGMFAGFAYHGNGVAMGSYVGATLADRISGQNTMTPPEAILRAPGKFPGGRLRRLAIWPAYLGFALQDR